MTMRKPNGSSLTTESKNVALGGATDECVALLYEHAFPRTLHSLVQRFIDAPKGDTVEAWVFDSRKCRRDAEQQLAERGVIARFRSAYKPLLHFFLEELDLAGVSKVRIAYPVHPLALPNRFLIEAYPLAAILADAEVSFEAKAQGDDLSYHLEICSTDGTRADYNVLAPNRIRKNAFGDMVLSPTGFLLTSLGSAEHVETDYEALFDSAMNTVEAFATTRPERLERLFQELNISVSIPASDLRLRGLAQETVSLAEALHEDLYFSILEYLQHRAGRPRGDRTFGPGQIVPEVRSGGDVPSIRIETRPYFTGEVPSSSVQILDHAAAPLATSQIRHELEQIPGAAFEARTCSGRVVTARYKNGGERAMMISSGQHGNEATGIVGALRAAKFLSRRPEAHFTISPLENPEGYELHRRLCLDNPTHMHHAARYTALGVDFEYRTAPLKFETAIRTEAQRLTRAVLHVNMHGYPSHEWTRPFSGYATPALAAWSLPKGFVLLLYCQDIWRRTADDLLQAVTLKLASKRDLIRSNESQLRLSEVHTGKPTNLRLLNGCPCLVLPAGHRSVPLTLVTEYPDETIYGDDFVAGHTAQMETAIAAYDALQQLSLPDQQTSEGG